MNKASLSAENYVSPLLDAAILVIEPDLAVWQKIQPTLAQYFGLVQHARTVELAVVSYRRFSFNLIIIDINHVCEFWQALASKNNPPRLAEKTHSLTQHIHDSECPRGNDEHIPPASFMVLSRLVEAEDVLSMMRMGASDFISKPVQVEQLESSISRWCLNKGHHLTHAWVQANSDAISDSISDSISGTSKLSCSKIVGDSETAEKIRVNLVNASHSNTSLLIEGQAGTGKRVAVEQLLLLAKSPHQCLTIDCSDELQINLDKLATDLATPLEQSSSVISHILLSHVDRISVAGQIALMQLLDSPEVDNNPKVRLISLACNSLLELVKNGAFSSELYYRLAGLYIYLPALNKRSEDIVLLVKFFTNQLIASNENCRDELLNRYRSWRMTDFHSLSEYAWPGNIQQLKNAVNQCLLMDMSPKQYFQQNPHTDCQQTKEPAFDGINSSSQHFFPIEWDVKQIEKAHTLRVIKRYEGNRALAAEHLGVSRKTIDRKVKEWAVTES